MAVLKSLVRPGTLTDCSLGRTLRGKLNHVIWKTALNRRRARSFEAGVGTRQACVGLLADLSENGIAVCHAMDFFGEDAAALLKDVDDHVRGIRDSETVRDLLQQGRVDGTAKDYLIRLVDFAKPLDASSPLLKLALHERLLTTVAEYLGMWPLLHSVSALLNFAVDDEAKASQLWHRDPEDIKTVKVFLYLDDVGPATGPFSYIPRTQGLGAECHKRPRHDHPRRIRDDEMAATFPAETWKECRGPAGTMIIADTVGFHRGGRVEAGQRLLVTFTYTSGTPQKKRNLVLQGWPGWDVTPIQEAALRQ